MTTCWLLEVCGRSVVSAETAASTRDAGDEARRDGSSSRLEGSTTDALDTTPDKTKGSFVSDRSVGRS